MGLREKGREELETVNIDKSFQESVTKKPKKKQSLERQVGTNNSSLCWWNISAENTLQATEFSLLAPPHLSQMRSWNEDVRTTGKISRNKNGFTFQLRAKSSFLHSFIKGASTPPHPLSVPACLRTLDYPGGIIQLSDNPESEIKPIPFVSSSLLTQPSLPLFPFLSYLLGILEGTYTSI